MRDGIVCGLCHRHVHLGGPLTKDCTSCGKLYRQLLSPAKTEPMPHDDLDKMRGEVDAAIRDCYLALGMGENVAFRKAVADRLTRKAT